MIRPEVTALYKYTTVNRALKIVHTDQIYVTHPSQLNDPFDMRIEVSSVVDPIKYIADIVAEGRHRKKSWKEIRSVLDTHLTSSGDINPASIRKHRNWAKLNRKQSRSTGVLCLAEYPVSILMWSHYGAAQKGVCVGFERTMRSGFIISDDRFTRPVEYSDMYPRFDVSDLKYGENLIRQLTTKAREWQYENEWRIFHKEGRKFAKIPGPINRVILGMRVGPKTTERFKTVCRERGISISRCAVTPNKFRLELVPVE